MILNLGFSTLIEDVKKALEANAHLSALALSLALPDICGKVEFSKATPKERYIKWFDENVTPNNYSPNFNEKLKFDGAKCYMFRCYFLHAGEINTSNGVDDFQLIITPTSPNSVYSGSTYAVTTYTGGRKKHEIHQDIAQLCFLIYTNAENFYNEYPNKEDFDNILKGVTPCPTPRPTTKTP